LCLGMTETAVARLLLFFSLFNIVGFVILGRMVFRHFRLYPIMISLLTRSLAFILLIWATFSLPIAMIMALFGLTTSVAYSAGIFHGTSGSVNRAKRMAIHEAMPAFGIVLGSVLGGVIYQRFSAPVLYGLTGLITLAGMATQIAFSIIRLRAKR